MSPKKRRARAEGSRSGPGRTSERQDRNRPSKANEGIPTVARVGGADASAFLELVLDGGVAVRFGTLVALAPWEDFDAGAVRELSAEGPADAPSVTLIRTAEVLPSWLSTGDRRRVEELCADPLARARAFARTLWTRALLRWLGLPEAVTRESALARADETAVFQAIEGITGLQQECLRAAAIHLVLKKRWEGWYALVWFPNLVPADVQALFHGREVLTLTGQKGRPSNATLRRLHELAGELGVDSTLARLVTSTRAGRATSKGSGDPWRAMCDLLRRLRLPVPKGPGTLEEWAEGLERLVMEP